jgi:manganese transport protein
VKKVFGVTLGILTAMGGFVDIGDLVANSATGARYGMSLAWAVVLGVVGIIVFAEMAGRVASVTKRAVFDLVRERLGARAGLLNLGASFFITMLTLIA